MLRLTAPGWRSGSAEKWPWFIAAAKKKCLAALNRAEKAMDIMVKDEGSDVQELELKIEGD